ncbi:hypothetical protein V6574_29050 [Streptomyces sp. SM1P]
MFPSGWRGCSPASTQQKYWRSRVGPILDHRLIVKPVRSISGTPRSAAVSAMARG